MVNEGTSESAKRPAADTMSTFRHARLLPLDAFGNAASDAPSSLIREVQYNWHPGSARVRVNLLSSSDLRCSSVPLRATKLAITRI
jgi:hypothetical protein